MQWEAFFQQINDYFNGAFGRFPLAQFTIWEIWLRMRPETGLPWPSAD